MLGDNAAERFRRTPGYYKVFAGLTLLAGLMPVTTLLPAEWVDGAWGKVSTGASAFYLLMLVYPFWIDEENRAGVLSIRLQYILFSVVVVGWTLHDYFDSTAREEFPWHRGFVFYPHEWVTGVILPVILTVAACLIPERALPIRRDEERDADPGPPPA